MRWSPPDQCGGSCAGSDSVPRQCAISTGIHRADSPGRGLRRPGLTGRERCMSRLQTGTDPTCRSAVARSTIASPTLRYRTVMNGISRKFRRLVFGDIRSSEGNCKLARACKPLWLRARRARVVPAPGLGWRRVRGHRHATSAPARCLYPPPGTRHRSRFVTVIERPHRIRLHRYQSSPFLSVPVSDGQSGNWAGVPDTI